MRALTYRATINRRRCSSRRRRPAALPPLCPALLADSAPCCLFR